MRYEEGARSGFGRQRCEREGGRRNWRDTDIGIRHGALQHGNLAWSFGVYAMIDWRTDHRVLLGGY